ncbi:MAG: DNA polymerase III subunit delta' [Pseudomonadota bacterium]
MTFPAPHERFDWIGDPSLEETIRTAINARTFSHGWMLTGAAGIGKATLAYRVARAVLAPQALAAGDTLDADPSDKAVRLVTSRAHPDLFVAERRWDEKKGRFEAEITVDTIRTLTAFLQRTPAMGGWRVAIIDSADELNRNASNALLKVLEEPPSNTVLLLVCNAPGRLIPTIRSRCRRLDLRPVGIEAVQGFLEKEGYGQTEEISAFARAAKGRPGYALTLAAGEGGEAIAALDDFFRAVTSRADISTVIRALSGKAGDDRWRIFKALVLEALTDQARAKASGEAHDGPLSHLSENAVLDIWSELRAILDRGDALNLDRGHMLQHMFRTISKAA